MKQQLPNKSPTIIKNAKYERVVVPIQQSQQQLQVNIPQRHHRKTYSDGQIFQKSERSKYSEIKNRFSDPCKTELSQHLFGKAKIESEIADKHLSFLRGIQLQKIYEIPVRNDETSEMNNYYRSDPALMARKIFEMDKSNQRTNFHKQHLFGNNSHESNLPITSRKFLEGCSGMSQRDDYYPTKLNMYVKSEQRRGTLGGGTSFRETRLGSLHCFNGPEQQYYMRQNLNLSIPDIKRIPIYQTFDQSINKHDNMASTRMDIVNDIVGRKKNNSSIMNYSHTNNGSRNVSGLTSPMRTERNGLVTQYQSKLNIFDGQTNREFPIPQMSIHKLMY